MDHDIDGVVPKPEQEMRLDDFEAFVDERRRVDRDARTHLPRGMRQRILGCHAGQLCPRPPAKWTTRCREEQTLDVRAFLTDQALEHGRVLGIDRDHLSTYRGCRQHQRSARNEALLVGEAEAISGIQNRQRCL